MKTIELMAIVRSRCYDRGLSFVVLRRLTEFSRVGACNTKQNTDRIVDR